MDLKKIIAAAEREDLEKFIIDMAKKSSEVNSMVVSRFSAPDSDDAVSGAKAEIKRIVRKNSDRDGFIDYDAAFRFEKEMSCFLSSIFPMLMESRKMSQAFEVGLFVFRTLGKIEIDDSDGETANLVCMIREFFKEIFPNLSGIELKNARENLERSISDEKIVDYIRYEIFEVYEELFSDRENLEAQLSFFDSLLSKFACADFCADDFLDCYEVQKCALARIRTMQKLSRSLDEIIEFAKKYDTFEDVCFVLVDAYLSKNDFQNAENALLRLTERNSKYLGIVHSARKKLLEVYRAQGEPQKIRQTLRSVFLGERGFNLDFYIEYKSFFDSESWVRELECLIEEKKDDGNFQNSIFIEEKFFGRLLENVTIQSRHFQGAQVIERYEKYLKDGFSAELVSLYAECLSSDVKMSNNRKHYAELARQLKSLSRLPGGLEIARSLRDEWISTYDRRRALKDELNSVRL